MDLLGGPDAVRTVGVHLDRPRNGIWQYPMHGFESDKLGHVLRGLLLGQGGLGWWSWANLPGLLGSFRGAISITFGGRRWYATRRLKQQLMSVV